MIPFTKQAIRQLTKLKVLALSSFERIEKEINKLLTEWDIEEKISLHIFKKFAQYKKEKNSELLKEVQSDIDMLKKLGATGMANRFAMEIEKYC